MQPLARDGLTAEQVRALLTGPTAQVDFGLSLLDDEDRHVEDISGDLVAASVERSMYADVHATCDLTLLRDVEWGTDRVQLWQEVTAGGQTVRFDIGVFLLTSPVHDAGETPRSRKVKGMDKLWLLQREVADTYVIASGGTYFDAIATVLADAGVTGALSLDGTRQATTLTEPAVWLLTDRATTWLDVVNDLLKLIGYRGLWVDERGRFRSQPLRDPAELGAEWTFDLTDGQTNVVGEERSLSADVWGRVNWWRFVRKQDPQPSEGAGIYTVDRVDGLPRRKTVFLDAADQAALVSLGDAVVAEDTHDVSVLFLETGPLPQAGHFDVVTVRDPETVWGRCQARRWSHDLATGAMSWELEVL